MTTHPAALDQPAPAPTDDDVWQEIIDDMPPGPLRDACLARRQLGIERYGRPLGRHNGRDHRVDRMHELLDAAAYSWALGEQDEARGLLCLVLDDLLALDVGRPAP